LSLLYPVVPFSGGKRPAHRAKQWNKAVKVSDHRQNRALTIVNPSKGPDGNQPIQTAYLHLADISVKADNRAGSLDAVPGHGTANDGNMFPRNFDRTTPSEQH
jgi:hypothetical protein